MLDSSAAGLVERICDAPQGNTQGAVVSTATRIAKLATRPQCPNSLCGKGAAPIHNTVSEYGREEPVSGMQYLKARI